MKEPLFSYGGRNFYINDVASAIRKSGVKEGDTIFVHSDLSVFGKLPEEIKTGTERGKEAGISKNIFLRGWLRAVKESVGKEGTIIMPAFTYSFCSKKVYDIENSKSTVGVLTEFFRKEEGVRRTIHPIFSAAVWGKDKERWMDISKDSFDGGSVFGMLHKFRGKILFLGASFQSCTFVHYIEQKHCVPYRYTKRFTGRIKTKEREYEDEYTYFVRYLDRDVTTDLSRLGKYLLDKGVLKEARLGNGRVLSIGAGALFEEGIKLLDKDTYFFLREKPKHWNHWKHWQKHCSEAPPERCGTEMDLDKKGRGGGGGFKGAEKRGDEKRRGGCKGSEEYRAGKCGAECGAGVNPKEAEKHTEDSGEEMYNLVKRLYPICRSITGEGVRKTLRVLQEYAPIKIYEIPSGTKAFDWTIPEEWNIRDAYVMDEKGNKVIDFKENNLSVVGYSIPVDKTVGLEELEEHLYSLEEKPDAIPYVTSYYEKRWGFCISYEKRKKLKKGRYRVFIDSDLKQGSLTYGELIIPGSSKKEVFLSTYICHPSMANNELSGPVVTAFLARWILSQRLGQKKGYTYRIIFIPETIGSIAYLSRNLDEMKKNIIAGFNITCVGDERVYSVLPSKKGDTLADRAALTILRLNHPDFIRYSFLDRGSDERQYCSPGIELPVASVMRSKYGTYPEYHTSADDLSLVTQKGLEGSYELLKDILTLLENNKRYKIKCLGEPNLGKRGLYPTLSTKDSGMKVRAMMNFIAYCDGSNDLIGISSIINTPPSELYPIIEKLKMAGLIGESD